MLLGIDELVEKLLGILISEFFNEVWVQLQNLSEEGQIRDLLLEFFFLHLDLPLKSLGLPPYQLVLPFLHFMLLFLFAEFSLLNHLSLLLRLWGLQGFLVRSALRSCSHGFWHLARILLLSENNY